MSITASPPPSAPPLVRPTILRHFVLAALLLITMINYVQRNAINPAMTTIQEDLALPLEVVGQITFAFFLSYTIMQVPSGLFAHFFGAKRTLVLIAAGWSLAIAGCAFAQGYTSFFVGRLLMGALQAGIFPCATLILKVWYPASRRGLATSLLNSFMLIGGAAGTVVTAKLLAPVGWRGVFLIYAVPGLLWAVWFAWWFYSRPQDHPGVNQAELDLIAGPTPAVVPDLSAAPRPQSAPSEQVKAHQDGVATAPLPGVSPPVGPVRRSRGALLALAIMTLSLLFTQQAFRAGANRLFDTWMPAYYETEKGTSKEVAGYLSAWLQVMGVVGGLTGGILSDAVLRRTKSLRAARNGVALFSLVGAVALYFAAYPIPNVYLSSLVFSLGVFLFCFSSPCAYALTMDVGGKYLAIVFALMNTLGNAGAALFVLFAGYLRHWGGWDLVLMVFVGMHVAAAVCWLFLDPNATLDDAFAPTPKE